MDKKDLSDKIIVCYKVKDCVKIEIDKGKARKKYVIKRILWELKLKENYININSFN